MQLSLSLLAWSRKRRRPVSRRRLRRSLSVEQLEERMLLSTAVLPEVEPNDSPAQATVLTPGDTVHAAINAPGDVDYFALRVTQPGALHVRVQPDAGSSLDSRITLSNTDSFLSLDGLRIGGGGLLVSSDNQAPGNPNPAVDQYLLPGQYFLAIDAPGQTGGYTLTTELVDAPDPFAFNEIEPALLKVVGDRPAALVTADFNRDGILDLATANSGSGDISVLLGIGDASFDSERRFVIGGRPGSLAAFDYNNDGRLDLAVRDDSAGDVIVLPGLGDGTFSVENKVRVRADNPALAKVLPAQPVTTVFGDFNRDGNGDRARLVPLGDGAGPPFANRVAVDVQTPGRPGLTIQTPFGTFRVHDLVGDAFYIPTTSITPAPQRATPLVVDLNGDGALDIVTVSRSGDILLRTGQPGRPGFFNAPVLVNRGDVPRARAVTLVAAGPRPLLAAVDLFRNGVSLYTPDPSGQWSRSGTLVTGDVPVRVEAGDLDGDGRPDLLVANNLFGFASLTLYHREANGSFTRVTDIKVGTDISDVQLVDVNGDGRRDVLLTNPDAGDLSVLLNASTGPGDLRFQPEMRLRAGQGPYGVVLSAATIVADAFFEAKTGIPNLFPPIYFVVSHEQTDSVAADDFNGDGVTDLVVSNKGTGSLGLLLGKQGADGFADPVIFSVGGTGSHPSRLRTADLNGDGRPDLVVLDEGTGRIVTYLGTAAGSLRRAFTADAGNRPTGLTVADVTGDGVLDLLVGNQFGDVLVLPGNGDGSFRPYQRANHQIALAVADLNGDGKDDFVFGNEGLDRVSVQYSRPGQSFVQDRRDGLLAPGAVRAADLNGDGIQDLVVANSGANKVLVYLGTGGGEFAPARSFAVGTNPTGLTLTDINGDGRMDVLVANEGSNDVSILLGDARALLVPGPRLNVGRGPVSTTVQDINGDGVPELFVTNSQSNDVWMLRGTGGFFNDRAPVIFAAGTAPRQTLIGNFDGKPGLDLVTVNAGSSNLSFYSNPTFTSPPVPAEILGSGGQAPVAAVAGDFNHDGLDDLLLANNGDGHLALLLGETAGPALFQTLAGTALEHPSSLALESEQDGTVSVYVTEEGVEGVERLAFTLEGSIAVPNLASSPVSEVRSQAPNLLALNDSGLPLVVTLQTGSVDSGRVADTPRDEGEASNGLAVLVASLLVGAGLPLAPGSDSAEEANSEAPNPKSQIPKVGPVGISDLGFSPSSDVSSGDPATDATLEERLEDALQNRPPLTREQLLEKEEEDPSSPENQEVLDQVFSEGQQVALLGRGLETTPQRGVKSRLSFDPGLLGGLAVTDGTVPSRADEDSPPLPDSSKNRAEEPRPLPEHSDAASVPSSFPREQSLSGPVAAALFALAVTHPWWVGDRDETRRSTRGKRRENRNL